MEKLLNNIFDEREVLSNKLKELDEKIISRIDYILRKIQEVFGSELDCWFISGAEEGELGNLDKLFESKEVINAFELEIEAYPVDSADCDQTKNYSSRKLNVIFNNKKYELGSYIPYRWLFEDFEEKLLAGKEECERKEIEDKKDKKNKRLKRKRVKEDLIKSAKLKLSKEEIKVLRI